MPNKDEQNKNLTPIQVEGQNLNIAQNPSGSSYIDYSTTPSKGYGKIVSQTQNEDGSTSVVFDANRADGGIERQEYTVTDNSYDNFSPNITSIRYEDEEAKRRAETISHFTRENTQEIGTYLSEKYARDVGESAKTDDFASAEIKRKNKEFTRDKRAWADTEGTTGSKRNDVDENGSYHWKGHTDENGNFISGLEEWTTDNETRLKAATDFATDGTWHTEEEMQLYQQEAANLYYDNIELENYVQEKVDAFKAEYDQKYASASEEEKATLNAILESNNAYLSHVQGMKEQSKNVYDTLASNNEYFGQWDRMEDVTAYVNDPKAYEKVGGTPEQLNTKLEAAQAVIESIEKRKNKYIGLSKEEKATLSEAKTTVSQLLGSDTKPGLIKQAEDIAKERREYAEDFNRNQLYGREYAIKKNADGSIGSYSMSDWREEEARLGTMLKTTSESSPSYAEISSKLKYIRDNYTDNYAKDEIRQKYASATDEEINAKIASLESNQPVVQQTNNVSAQLEQARKDLKALESQAMAKPEEYLAAKARVDELEAAQKTGTEAPKPVEKKVLTYSEQLELDTLKEIQANRLNANVLQNYKDYQDKFGAEGALQWQNAIQESIATARQERDAGIAHWQEAGAALGEYYVIPKTGDFADIRAALKAANISEDDTTRAAAFIQNHIEEVSRNSSIAIAGLEYENAVATVARDIDLSQAKDYDSTVKKAKDKYSVEEMRTAFNSVQDVMWDINGGVSDGTKSRGILAGLGITGKEADELMKMITTYGLDVSYLTPTTAETDANADPKNFYAYGQKRGFFSEEQVNNWYYLLEHDGAVAAAKYALDVNMVLNSQYRDLLESNRSGVLAYDAKNNTASFIGEALAYPIVTPFMEMTSPIDYIKLRDQVKRLGTDIVNPTPSVAEYGNMITELYTNQIGESAGRFAGFANFAYGVYGSTIQSAEVAFTGGLLGKAMGLSDALTVLGKGAQNLVAGMFSDLTFFSGAAVQSYHDFREKGIDPQRALSAATWAGVAEAAFEHISFEKLYHAKDVFDWTSWKDWAVETAVSGAIEGSEEVFTSMANFLSESAILGKDGSYWRAVEEYEKLGLDQNTAMKKAMWDTVQNWAVDFAAGAVSGGISVGSSSAFNYKAYTNEINESAKKLGARINDAKIEGDKTLAQKMGEYFGSYEYYNEADSIKPNKQQMDEVNTLKNLADKAAKGEASADEIGQMVVLANRYSEKLFTDFVFANTKTFMAISPGLVIDAATKGLNAVFGKEETQKILTAFYEHPDAFVEDSFEVGLKNAVGDKLSSDEIENIEYLLGYVLTGNNAYTEEDLRNSIRNLITDEGVQNFILSYFKEQIDQYNHPKGRFALFGKSTDSATQPWFVHTTNENTMTGSFEDVLVNVWNGTKTAAHYVTMQKQAIDSVNNAFQSLSDAINQASTKAAQYRDAGDFFVAKGPDGKDHIFTREFFIQQHKKGIDPLTGKPSAFRDLVDTDEKLNAEFDGQLRATIGAGGLADMVRYNLRTGEEKSAEQTQKLKDQLQDILSVPDANVAILRNEIRDIDRQLQDLYTQAEMAKASNEPLPDQHDAAVKNLEERKARAEADLKIIQERAKVRSNGRIQTHDSGTSGRNGSADERRNAGGIPYSGTGSDSGGSGVQADGGRGSESGSGETLREQEVILKDGDDAVATMDNGTVIYDSDDPNANTDNLTSEEKDVLQRAKKAGVDRLIFVDADQLWGDGNRAAGYYVIIGGKKTIVVNSNRGTVNGYHEAMHYCLDSYTKEEKRSILDEFVVGVFKNGNEFTSFFNLYNNEVHQKVYASLYKAFKNGNTAPYYYALYEEMLCDLWHGLNRYHIPNDQFKPLQQRAYAFVVEKQIVEHAADKAKQNKGEKKSEVKKAPETHGGIPRAETPETQEAPKVQEASKAERTIEEQKSMEFFDFLVRQSDDFDLDPFITAASDARLQYISGLNGASDAEKQVIATVKREVERRQAEDRRTEEASKSQPLDTSIGEARLAQVRENVHNLSEAELAGMMRQMADILGKLSKDNPDRIILEPVANILINEYRNRLTESESESSEEEGTVISNQPATDLPLDNPTGKAGEAKVDPEYQGDTEETEESDTEEDTGNPLKEELASIEKEIKEIEDSIKDVRKDRDQQIKKEPDKDMRDLIKGQANNVIKMLKDQVNDLKKRATAIRSQLLKENKKNKNANRGSVIEANSAKGSKKTPNHTADTHIDNRSLDGVGKTNINAFQYDNPEIKPFFKRAAEVLMHDLIYLQSTRRNEYGKGTFFEVDTDFLEAVRNNFESINDAVAACEAVIYDKGGENYVGPKRIEIFLDQMLTNGYAPINQDSETIEPSIDYINLKGSLEGGTPFDARQKAIEDLRLAYLEDGLTDEELGRIVDENKARTGYYDPDTRDGLGEAAETTTEAVQEETVQTVRTVSEIDAEMDGVSAEIENLMGQIENAPGNVSEDKYAELNERLQEREAYYDTLQAEWKDAYATGRFSVDDTYSPTIPDLYGKFSVESLANGTGFETLYQIAETNKLTTLEDWIKDIQNQPREPGKEMPTRDSLQEEFSRKVKYGEARVYGVARRNADGTLTEMHIENITSADMRNSPLGFLVACAEESGRISKEEAERQYDFLRDLTRLLFHYHDEGLIWEVVGSEMFAAIKSNSDPQYNRTIDFSTICKKTQAVIDAVGMTMQLLDTGLSKDEIKLVYKLVGEAGESTPCPVCYVFSRWMGLGSVLDNIKRYQQLYGDTVPGGKEKVLELVKEVQRAAEAKMEGTDLTFGKAVNAAQKDVELRLKVAESAFNDYEKALKNPNAKKYKGRNITRDENGNPRSQDYWAEQISSLAKEYDKFDAYKWAVKTRLINADLLVKNSEAVAAKLARMGVEGETLNEILQNAKNSNNDDEDFVALWDELQNNLTDLEIVDEDRLKELHRKQELRKQQSSLKAAVTKEFGKDFTNSLKKLSAIEQALKEHPDSVALKNLYENRKEFDAIGEEYVFRKGYEDVPDDVLFDLNQGEKFARYYPATWSYRTTRGSGLGKAIMPYSDARVGEIIQGMAASDVKNIQIGKDKNAFLNLVFPEKREEAKKILANARKKMAAQNLIGGMRFQSTSDFRYEYASDYLMAFFEMQAMGANVQLYTKVLEAVDFFANVGCDVNLSVMPRDKGIGVLNEKPRDWDTNYDRYFTRKNNKYVRLKKGDTAPEFVPGKYHAILYSDVTGVNGGAAREYVNKYDNVQMIMVGISADHINACLDSDDITFVIPFHGSGNSTKDIQQLMQLLGETIDAKNITDFTPYQTDTEKEKISPARDLRKKIVSGGCLINGRITLTTEEANILEDNAFLKDLFRRFYLDATDRNGRVDRAESEKNRQNVTILTVHEDGTTSVNKDFNIDFGKVNDRAFAKKYYLDGKNECYGNFLSGITANQIFPYEYWDKSLKQSEAKGNGDAFQEYCKSLGLIPRFSGWAKGKYSAKNDFTKNDNYWKLLIDRKMYDNQGNYRAQRQIDLSNIDAFRYSDESYEGDRRIAVTDLNPNYGQVTFGNNSPFANRVNPKVNGRKDNSVISKINDPRKTNAIATIAAKIINEARDKSDSRAKRRLFADSEDIRQAIDAGDYITAANMLIEDPGTRFYEENGTLYLETDEGVMRVEKNGDLVPVENTTEQAEPFMDDYDTEGKFSAEVTDPDELAWLNKLYEDGDVVFTYKSYLEYEDENGVYLIAPMAGFERDEENVKKLTYKLRPMQWVKSTSNPDSTSIKKSKTGWLYHLEKNDDGSDVWAAFNPYEHSGDLAINDQFAVAYRRPRLVTYVCAIPKSELTSGYHYGVTDPENARRSDGQIVKAKNSVGILDWKTGAFGSQLFNSKRHTYLSRWIMPVRKVSDEEVARQYKELIDREPPGLGIPFNVVPQNVRNILEDMGVPIDITGTGYGEPQYRTFLKDVNEQRIAEGKEPYPYSYIPRTKAEKDAIKKRREAEAKKMREERGEEWANQIVGDLNSPKSDNSFAVKENKRGQYQIDFDSAKTPTVRYSVDEQDLEVFGNWLNSFSSDDRISSDVFESEFRLIPEVDFYKKMIDAGWLGDSTKAVEKEFQQFVSSLDDYSKERLLENLDRYIAGSNVSYSRVFNTSDKIAQKLKNKLKSILEKELDKVEYKSLTEEQLSNYRPDYIAAIQQMYDRDENGNFIDDTTWHKSHQALYDLFTKHPELDYLKRLANATTTKEKNQIRAEFEQMLSGINDRDALWQLSAYSFYPSMGTWNGGSRIPGLYDQLKKAKRVFSNIIEKRRDQILMESGESSNVKLEAREYTLQEVIDMFNQLNRDEQLNPLAEKVFKVTKDLGLTIRGAQGKAFSSSKVGGHQLGSVVEYNINRFNDLGITDQFKATILLHELIHACTQYAIRAHDLEYSAPRIRGEMLDAVQQIMKVYNEVKADPALTNMYGATNASEMLSELSNPKFREALEKKNLFQRIVDAIKKFFGIDTKNALDAASVGLDYLLDNFNYDSYLDWVEYSNRYLDSNPAVTEKARQAISARHPGEVRLYNGYWVKQEFAEYHDYDQAWYLKPEYNLRTNDGIAQVMEWDSVAKEYVPAGSRDNTSQQEGFMSGVIDDNSNYTIDGFFDSFGNEVTVGKFSVDDILSVTYFAGAGTFDYALRDRLFPIYAVEYDPAIRDMFVKNNGNSILITDADVNEVNPRTVLAGHVPYFHASPVCTNFSKANNKSGETERDRKFARAIAEALHEWQPDAFTLENVKGYIGSDSLQIVLDALDELGYSHDGYEGNVYRASDYGAATIRDRLFVRAVKDGELPPKPVKTGPTSWWSAVEDIIDTLPVMDESGLTEARRTRLRNMGIDINNLKQPILLLSGTKGREIQYAYADQPSPTLMTDGSEARIILTDGTILKVTPRVYARIQGLDDEFQFPTQKRNPDKTHQSDAFKIIGNGIPTQLTRAIVNPLLDTIEAKNKQKIDDQYLGAIERGDLDMARALFDHYVLEKNTDAVTPFLYTSKYSENYGHNSAVAHGIKLKNAKYLNIAADEMVSQVPDNAVLIPMPGRHGYANDTLELAQAIADRYNATHDTQIEVLDILKGNDRPSQYETKRATGKSLNLDTFGMYLDGQIPEGKFPVLIDNVVASGTTATAAQKAVGGGMTLAFAYGDRSKPVAGLKFAEPITYDDNGNPIPLSERFNPDNPDMRYSTDTEPEMGLNFRDPAGELLEKVFDPNDETRKKYETRPYTEKRGHGAIKSAWLNKEMGLIQTGAGPAQVVGTWELGDGEPKDWQWLNDHAAELGNDGTEFQAKEGDRKWVYPIKWARRIEEPRPVTSWGPQARSIKFSVDIDPDAAFDSFGYEVELDDYSPVVTQSDLSENLYYSDDGNTAYYMTDTGETVILNNVGTDSPEARYIEYLEAMQNANDTNTTATKPYIIPPANRNGNDGYNLYQPNAGLRYGAEEVLEENQKGTLRPAGSNGELYAEGVPQSEETQGVRYSAEEESPGARYSTMYDADSDTFVNENGEVVATDDMYPIGSFTREIFKALKSGDQSLKNVEDLINKLLDRKFNIYEEDYNTVRQMIQINDAYTPEQRKAMLDAMEKLVKKHGKMRSAKEDMNQDLHFAVQRDQGDTIDDPNHKGKKITRKEFVKRATEGKDPFTGKDSDKTMTEKEANELFDKQGTVIMKFTQTVARNTDKEWLTDEAVRMALTDESMSYTPVSNDQAIRRAQQRFDRAGTYEKALAEWDGIVHSERTPKQVDVAFGELLLKSAAEQGRINDTVKLVSDLTLMAHTTGQTLQAFRILKKMTPRGQLYYIQSVVDDLNKRYDSRIKNGKMGRVTLNQDLVELLLSSSTREELDTAVDLIKRDLAEQIPATWMDQWNAWRYLAMLGNPRTHFRNIFGNGAFMPAVFIKDMISRRLETKYVDPKLRMRIAGADLSKNSAYRQRAEQDFKVMAKIIAGEAGGNKYSDIQDILGQRDVFPFKWLNDLARFNGGRLTAEDMWFMHKYYTRAFAEALQARGIKEEDVQNFDTNPDGRKILNEVRNWAMEEAQRNTYHDANKLASLLNQMKRSSPAAYVVLEGLVPFTKTPANILKRGIEYSPIGLISSYIQLGRDLRSGEYSTSQCIDRLAAGWTGTGFLILGFILSKLGILRGGGPDDKKEEAFESLQGHQPWSIEIGGLSYTLDWMAPLALPLFVGATIYSMLKGDHVDITDADTWMALTRIADPLLSLSMLDGIENTLSAVSNANNTSKLGVLGISMLGSYIAQGMPTIFGQAARILDTNRRKTFVPEDAKSSALKQWVQSSIQAKIPDPLRLFGGNIPGTEDDKKLYVDMWGRTEGADTFGEVLWKIAENVISPGYHKWINETPVDAELQRLYEATEDKSVLPGYVDKSIGPQSQGKDDEGNEIIIDGKKLTADEMTKYEMTVGQNRYQLLNDIFASPEYQAATETEKKKIVNDAYAYAKSLGEKAVIAGRDHDSEWMNLADKIGASDYILIRQEYESNKSNKKIFSWLVNNPNLNESQVATLIADKFNPPDNVESISTSGFLYDLKGSDEDAIKEINAQIIKDGLRELYRSEEYQNAPDKDVMLKQFYEDSKAETLRVYGEMLDQTDRVKYIGKAATIGAESFNKVLDLTTADVKGDYRSDIEAQSSWLGYKYKADTSINNPLHEGYSIELDTTQRSRLESRFRDRWNEAYDELLHSEKFQNAPSREYQEDMIARRFNQVSTEVENEYAAELYQAGGYSETFGKPGSFTWSKAYEIADRELSTPKEQAEWLAGKYSPGSSIDDPDQAAYEIALTTEDKNQLKKEFASAYVPRYVKMVNSDEFKALDPTTQEYKKEELRKDVAKSVQEAYARKLKADGYASVAFDDKANLANKYEYLASNDLSDKEKIEIIKDSYVGGTIANAEARGYRKKMFDEWMDNPANTKSYLEQNTADGYEKMRKAADKYAGDLTKKKYGGVKNYNQIEDFDLYDVYYTTNNPIDSTPPVKIDAPATSKTDSGALLKPGNIDLNARPIMRNSDGTYSTVDTVTWEVDGQYINVPTVIYVDGETINGEYVEGWVHVDDDAALEHYYETGEHLGIYSDKDSAVKAAEQLHKDQAKQYDSQANFWAGLIRH